MGFSVASLRKVLLLVVLMSPVASSVHSNGNAIKSKLWRKESLEVQVPTYGLKWAGGYCGGRWNVDKKALAPASSPAACAATVFADASCSNTFYYKPAQCRCVMQGKTCGQVHSSPTVGIYEITQACDESSWPDKDHGLVCGDCKVLVNNFASKYKTCDGYCNTVGRNCANAWEESADTCRVKHTMTCDQRLRSSDAICECGPMKAVGTSSSTEASCPWKSGTTGKSNTVMCSDGAYVTDWKCALGGHGQRVKCTPEYPKMCAALACGGNEDHCCDKDCSDKGGERPCPTTSAPVGESKEVRTINIEIGGDAHGKGQGDAKGYLKRPEALKSKACTASACEECSNPASCWHGEDMSGSNWGYLALKVLKGSKFTHYVAEVWARCPSISTEASWHLSHRPDRQRNGLLELHAGSTKVDLSQCSPDWPKCSVQLPIRGEDTARIRLSWYPIDKDQESYVKVWLEAWKVDSSVDSCMAVKDCLDILGIGSSEAFKLRNANAEQFSCLLGQLVGMSSGMVSLCEKWDSCVTTSGKKPLLLALLGAALKKHESLLEGVSFANATQQIVDTESCVDPEVDDPESWDCECAEEMTATCSGPTHADQDLETCIQTLLCKNPNVCSSWVAGHCAGSLMEQRSQAGTKVASIENLHNGLDSAVQGKCSQ